MMKKRYPELIGGAAVQPAARTRSRSRRPRPSTSRTSRASLRPLPPGVHEIETGKKYSKRVLQVAHVIELIFTIATVDPAHRRDAADREHDPALDLLAAARDRGDEARRRDELVHPRPVHDRRPALRRSAAPLLAVLFLLLGKEVALPAIHPRRALERSRRARARVPVHGADPARRWVSRSARSAPG